MWRILGGVASKADEKAVSHLTEINFNATDRTFTSESVFYMLRDCFFSVWIFIPGRLPRRPNVVSGIKTFLLKKSSIELIDIEGSRMEILEAF